jgi:hypothetical protein
MTRRKTLVKCSAIFIIAILSGCATLNQSLVRYDSEPEHKAFAVDSNGVYGLAWGQSDSEAAINLALKNCAAYGGVNCKISRLNSLSAQGGGQVRDESSFSGARVSCASIGKAEAYQLLISGHTYLDRDGDGHPCEWSASSYYSTPSISAPSINTPSSGNCHYVGGYTRKNGTHVSGYMRCR